ncbi:hypothetical protein [Thioflexithrix psekupsensis]|uniref:Uncharacterized protein n=1 Tax=Thioflexithrix psekupsensis TaxID=1570016 RepID=A0A251X7J1_9GAMM|nr:hypothetical protein [Thioflexithrix psekupsensis]OUD13900.1 hypothetical protein TPSD3_06025 [Thioflexithrix psekupsensis]
MDSYSFAVVAPSVIIISVIALIYLRAITKNYRVIKTHHFILTHLKNAPIASPEYVDCYVLFSGRLSGKNTLSTSPLFGMNGLFFQSQVIAQWESKEKKPNKGMKTHKKTIFEAQSAPVIYLKSKDNDLELEIDLSSFYKEGHVSVYLEHKEQEKCPEYCQEKADARYSKYHLIEAIFNAETTLTVYGQLIQKETRKFCLTPTHALYYPSLIFDPNTKELDTEIIQLCHKEKKISVVYIVLWSFISLFFFYWPVMAIVQHYFE